MTAVGIDQRLDRVRVAATVAIVVIHVGSAAVWNAFPIQPWWWAANVLGSLARVGVPLFIMVSGAIFLNRCDPWQDFYLKRMGRILPALLFWSILYVLLQMTTGRFEGWDATVRQGINGGVYYHLWFLYPLLVLYLFVPLLQRASAHELTAIAMLCAYATGAVYVASSWTSLSTAMPQSVVDLRYFLLYFIVGHALTRYEFTPRQRQAAWLASLVCTGATAWLTYTATAPTGKLDSSWYRYDSPWVVINSVACFVLLMGCKAPLSRFWQRIGALSFGVYLVHAGVLTLLQDVGWGGYRFSTVMLLITPDTQADAWFPYPVPLLGIPLLTVLVLALSLGIVALLSRVPGLRRVVG